MLVSTYTLLFVINTAASYLAPVWGVAVVMNKPLNPGE